MTEASISIGLNIHLVGLQMCEQKLQLSNFVKQMHGAKEKPETPTEMGRNNLPNPPDTGETGSKKSPERTLRKIRGNLIAERKP